MLPTKCQNKGIDDSPDIFNRCNSQICRIFLCMLINPPSPTLLFDLGLGVIDAENIDVALTKNAKTFFVAINLIVIK